MISHTAPESNGKLHIQRWPMKKCKANASPCSYAMIADAIFTVFSLSNYHNWDKVMSAFHRFFSSLSDPSYFELGVQGDAMRKKQNLSLISYGLAYLFNPI